MVEFPFHINGDMSERVMSIIESMVPASEVYSIDKNKLHTMDAQS
ncbi:UmuC [Pseudomonas syringae pv. aptata]|nr:UmuC [Pseudomonas syringae pv. aptata]